MPIKLTVNQVATTVDVPPEYPVAWVLRDVSETRGNQDGCGIGACGACTVLATAPCVRA